MLLVSVCSTNNGMNTCKQYECHTPLLIDLLNIHASNSDITFEQYCIARKQYLTTWQTLDLLSI